MADRIETDDDGKTYKNGVLQVKSGSPGVGGAISDAVSALQKAFAPKSLTQRGQKLDQQIDEESGAPASSLGNQF